MAQLFVVEQHEGGDSWRTVFTIGGKAGQSADGTFSDRASAERVAGGKAGHRVREVSEPCLYFTGSARGDAQHALDSIRQLASLGTAQSGNAYNERRELPMHLKLLQRAIDTAHPAGQIASTTPGVTTSNPRGEEAIARIVVERVIERTGTRRLDLSVQTATPEMADALHDHLARTVDQFMGPLGHWSKTPPTEPGFFWCRFTVTPEMVFTEWVTDEDGVLMANRGDEGEEELVPIAELHARGIFEWHTERIPKPPR